MKTIIIYLTKYGAARETAQLIMSKINGAVIHDLEQGNPSLTDYNCVIIGCSIYAGGIKKEMREFLKHNTDILKTKNLGLFLCGLQANAEEKNFTTNFPKELLKSAKIKSLLGGIYDPSKYGFLARLIMQLIAGNSNYKNTINDKKIEEFVKAVVG